MLQRMPTGTWLPAWVPESTVTLSMLLIVCSMVKSATNGYDGSMLSGLNILPLYTEYFKLNSATTGLQTASVFIGCVISSTVSGIISDRLGQRLGTFWGSVLCLVGVILRTAAQNIAMFVVARIFIGFGMNISDISSAVYLSETFASQYRSWGVGILMCFNYVALIAAGITLKTGQWDSTWAWRAPSLIQGIFSVLCILILPFVPESLRWLVHQGLYEDARLVVAQTNANGDKSDPIVLTVYKEIVETLKWERDEGKTVTPVQILRNLVARKRLLIGISPGPFSFVASNIVAAYYLGAELDTAGITNSDSQLQANVVLNVWCLICSLVGTFPAARWGRKPTALLSQCLLTACLLIIGGLSKAFADNPTGASQHLIYGDVAAMFLFQCFYCLGWTPLLLLYPPEVMNYSIRANGLALSEFFTNSLSLVFVFIMPIALKNIGWKMYILNASWDIVIISLVAFYWVETKGRTLEEIDAIFEGKKHSSVPDVALVRSGQEKLDIDAVIDEITGENDTTKRVRVGDEDSSRSDSVLKVL